jgi:cleavage and polyadenylation specificity factor subunit 1
VKPGSLNTNTHTGATDGTLSALTPLDEQPFKRLQLLQGQLTHNVQHVAGLNPKMFRWVSFVSFVMQTGTDSAASMVRNDFVSKPLSKGILDGNLLAHFEGLAITRQDEVTRQIATDRMTVTKDWIGLSGPW